MLLVFCLSMQCLLGQSINRNLCRCTDLQFETILPGGVCSLGGEKVTISNYKESKDLTVCNPTTSNATANAGNVIFVPQFPQLFGNQVTLSIGAAMNISSMYFITITNSTIAPGGTCQYGGVAFTFSSIVGNTTMNNCFLAPNYTVTNSNGAGVSLIGNSTANSLQLLPLAGAGAASVSNNGTNVVIFVAPSSGSYVVNDTTVTGESPISVTGVAFTTMKRFVNSPSVFFLSDTDGIMANINFLVTDASDNGTSFIYYTDGLTLSLKTLIVSGILTMNEVNGTLYLNVPATIAANFTVTATSDGVNPVAASFNNSAVMKSFVDSPSVQFAGTATNISANAILTLQSATTNGSSLFVGTTGNTGILKTLRSNVPGFTISDDGVSLALNWAVICSDGRPSILINNIAVCDWQFTNVPVFAGCSSGAFVLSWSNGSQPLCLPGPAVYSPATPSLWPANTTIVDQALNYLGIYRAQDGICPSAGQSMITVNGVSVCATRIDPGPAIPGCKNGVYNLDSGIASGTVCLPQVWDGSEITVNTLVANLSLACGFQNDVTSTLNCIYNEFIVPGLVNQTSASTIVYTPPFQVNCLSSFSLSAMLTFLIVGQLPNNTFNVYVNPVVGDDTCGGGTFARPYASIPYAVTKIPPAISGRLFNIILSVNTHTVVGDLYLPPNVQFTTTGNLRFTTINVTGNIYLNSTWGLYANDQVLGGFSGITIYYNQMVIDFRTIGSYGPNSDARLELYNCGLFGNGVYVYGRGSVDLFHVDGIDSDNDIAVNCATFHQEKTLMSSANTVVTDYNCTTPTTQAFFHQYAFNGYFESSSLAIYQTTSDMHMEIHNNAFDDGSLILIGTIQDSLLADVSSLPINLFYNSFVKFEVKSSTKGIAQANLSVSYWGDSFQTADLMFLTLQSRSKNMVSSGAGQYSFIYTSTDTTNIINELSLTSSYLTASTGAGVLSLGFIDPVSNIAYNSTNCFLHEGIYICQTQIIAVNDSNCVNGTGYVINVGNGVSYAFCPSAPDNDSTIAISYAGTGASPFKSLTATDAIFKGSLGSANIAVTPGLNDNTYALVDNPVVNTMTATGFFAVNESSFCYQNSAGFENCFSAASALAGTFLWKWPTSELVGGFLSLGPSGQMSWMAVSASGVITYMGAGVSPIVFTNNSYTILRGYTGSGNIVVTGTGTDVNIAVSANPSFTSVSSSFASVTSHLDLNSLASLYFWNAANTLYTILGISNSQATNLTFLLPSSPGVTNNALFLTSATQLAFGTLPVGGGGTGATTLTGNGMLYMDSGGTVVQSAVASNGQFFVGSAGNPPQLTTLTPTAGQTSVTNGPGTVQVGLATNVQTTGTLGDGTGFYCSITTAVAGAGTTQGTATVLPSTTCFSVLTTPVNSGVLLPTPTRAGFNLLIFNRGANTLNVYPNSGAAIDGAAANAPVVISSGASAMYVANSTTQWYTMQFVVVPGTNILVAYGNGVITVSTSLTPTFTTIAATATSNQFTVGTGNQWTLNYAAPAGGRTLNFNDPGVSSTSVVMTDGSQTINGGKIFTTKPIFNSNVGTQYNNAANTASVTVGTQAGLAGSYSLNWPTGVGNANDELQGDGAGNLNFRQPSAKMLHSNTVALVQNNPGAAVFVTMYPTGAVSLTIPANTLATSSKIEFSFEGAVSTSAATTFSIRVRLDGSTTYGTSTSSTGVSLSSIPFTCRGFFSIFNSGAGGVASTSGHIFAFTSTTNAVAGFTSTGTIAIDTTVSHVFDVQFAFSASNAANVLTVLGSTMNHFKPYA